ncbi:hypothetical protein GYMLUDRAFT_173749, partial [Collybiopsis luxurians FD-317 M1]
VDRNGLPLSPQPSDDPEDPLNWPLSYRIFVLLQASLLSSLGNINTAIINPAYGELSKEFGISTVTASYQTTAAIAMNGIGPFLFVPLANAFGRRPVYIATTLIGFASALGCAFAHSFGGLVGARLICSYSCGFFLTLSTAQASDLFCLHERGRALGLYTVLYTGGHFAPIPSGLIGQFLGWRWIFKITAICNGVALLFIFFFLPETLYIRDQTPSEVTKGPRTALERYLWRTKLGRSFPGRQLKLSDFVWPYVKMVRYPSVLFPAIYYSAQVVTFLAILRILTAVTVFQIFSEEFGWNTLLIGLAYGGALLIGSFLGETAGGWVVDRVMTRARQRAGNESAPSEVRLQAIWTGEILVPAGLLIYGFSIQFQAPWIVPLVGLAIACFGVQCLTTVMYTYSTDCYRDKSAEVSQVFNFIR